ncbi:MAG: bifunctional nicotinamidase/pyrazinamidase [Ardenticatenaceae bacterium]
MTIDDKSALIIVDVQNDFCPGGALPVALGDEVVPVLNRYAERFAGAGAPVFATRDWHPANHVSFTGQGGIWPAHCVQESEGAAFHPDLELPPATTVVSKAQAPQEEAYSGFMGTDLAQRLRAQGVERVFVGGLATDYCVKSTVLDALAEGFDTYFLADAARGVEVNQGDVAAAEAEMAEAGAKTVTLDDAGEAT